MAALQHCLHSARLPSGIWFCHSFSARFKFTHKYNLHLHLFLAESVFARHASALDLQGPLHRGQWTVKSPAAAASSQSSGFIFLKQLDLIGSNQIFRSASIQQALQGSDILLSNLVFRMHAIIYIYSLGQRPLREASQVLALYFAANALAIFRIQLSSQTMRWYEYGASTKHLRTDIHQLYISGVPARTFKGPKAISLVAECYQCTLECKPA